ncbi:hypothetical protein Bca52824_033058 [Brassica carinata]|uniref:Uncharacterized protein n=1 Tax=Brassica carinata TaxID=52824 RepID=A0A8X7SE99_BRACI|nr:hypothetical protein Bca52824_033058 [Brassica carinata]
MMGNEETSQASASIEEESVNTKLNRIIEVMEGNLKSMKDRMSLLEEENMQLKARVSELEGNQNVGPYTQTVVFPTNVTQQNDTQPSSGTPLSPMSQQNETQDFSPNLRQQKETEQSLDGTSFNPNRAEENIEDEIEKEPLNQTLPAHTQFFSSDETKLEPLNDESPASPASKQIETQVFSPNPTQHIEQEPLSNETPDAQTTTHHLTDPLTELISSIAGQYMNSDDETQTGTQVLPANVTQQENTQVVANTPASPSSSLKLDENQNDAVAETQTGTQFFYLNATLQPLSEEKQSNRNKEGENPADEDATELVTEIISTYISETMPLSQQTQPLTTSPIHFSETKKMWRLRLLMTLLVEYGIQQRRVQNTITTDRIRPAPPTSDQKAFEMSDNVEVFYKNGWCSGQVKMVLGDNTEWIDRVWKMADEMQTGYFKGPETQSQKPNKKRKAACSSQESGKDIVVPFVRWSERVPKRSRDTKTPFKSERNPALTVKCEIISVVDPFSTPADHKLQRLQNWLTSTGGVHETLFINKAVTRKSFFQYIENEEKDLRAVHIDGAFAMLNCRRNENAAWFHNNKIPKAYFLPTTSSRRWGTTLILSRNVQQKIWKTLDWNGRRLEKRTITLFHCDLPTEDKNDDISQIEELAVLLLALMMEAFGEEVNKKEVVPYKIEKAEEDTSKINDANAMELRRSLSCEIFNQFVDANV